jgi:hypothetical protein
LPYRFLHCRMCHNVDWHLDLRVFEPKTTSARSARVRSAMKRPQKLLVVDYWYTGWNTPDWNKQREFAVRSVYAKNCLKKCEIFRWIFAKEFLKVKKVIKIIKIYIRNLNYVAKISSKYKICFVETQICRKFATLV